MARHRAGDRRIISVSLPEQLARRLDRQVGKGREHGRSATIVRLIEQGLQSEARGPPEVPEDVAERVARAGAGDVRLERDSMGELEVAACLAYQGLAHRARGDLARQYLAPYFTACG